jgi:hypothetical protein
VSAKRRFLGECGKATPPKFHNLKPLKKPKTYCSFWGTVLFSGESYMQQILFMWLHGEILWHLKTKSN